MVRYNNTIIRAILNQWKQIFIYQKIINAAEGVVHGGEKGECFSRREYLQGSKSPYWSHSICMVEADLEAGIILDDDLSRVWLKVQLKSPPRIKECVSIAGCLIKVIQAIDLTFSP